MKKQRDTSKDVGWKTVTVLVAIIVVLTKATAPDEPEPRSPRRPLQRTQRELTAVQRENDAMYERAMRAGLVGPEAQERFLASRGQTAEEFFLGLAPNR